MIQFGAVMEAVRRHSSVTGFRSAGRWHRAHAALQGGCVDSTGVRSRACSTSCHPSTASHPLGLLLVLCFRPGDHDSYKSGSGSGIGRGVLRPLDGLGAHLPDGSELLRFP